MTILDRNLRTDGAQMTLAERLLTLTRRETEVLEFLVQGKTNDQIALALVRSPKTIDKHCQNIYQKTKIHKRVNLVREVLNLRKDDVSTNRTGPASAITTACDDLIRKSRAWDKMAKFESILSRTSGPEYFGNLSIALAETFGVKMAGMCEVNAEDGFGVIISYCIDGELQVPFQYDLANSACGIAHAEGKLEQYDKLSERLGDEDRLLVKNGFKSYVGIRLVDRLMGPIGTLWIADDKPIDSSNRPLDILKHFASCVASELAVQIALDQSE